mgnify:CR=1 FL=1|jgi:Phosphoribosylamine-glycine ligase
MNETEEQQKLSGQIWVRSFPDNAHIVGWAFCRKHPEAKAKLVLSIDCKEVARFEADRFRKDLLAQGFSDGTCSFKIPIPEEFLDGKVHEYTVESTEDSPFVVKPSTKRALFPVADLPLFNRPWVAPRVPNQVGDETPVSIQSVMLDVERAVFIPQKIELLKRLFLEWPGSISSASVQEVVESLDVPLPSMLERMRRRHEWLYGEGASSETLETDPLDAEAAKRIYGKRWIRVFNKKQYMTQFAKALGVKTPNILAESSDPAELLSGHLPERFVLKLDGLASNLGVFVVCEGINILDNSPADKASLIDNLIRLGGGKRNRRYFIEEFLEQENCSGRAVIPLDYKMHCFGGKVLLFQVIDRNFVDKKKTMQSFYTRDWRRVKTPVSSGYIASPDYQKPACFEELIFLGDRLSESLGAYARIDAFSTTRGAVFGEVTIYPGSGRTFTRFGSNLLTIWWDMFYGNDSL